jgi:hypothetical protein
MKFLFPKEFITIFGPTFTPHKSNIFFVEFDWPMLAKKKFETVRAPKKLKILWIDGVPPPFAHLYM